MKQPSRLGPATNGSRDTLPTGLTDLRHIWTPGTILVDANDDGVVDGVDLSIILGQEASDADVVAAANIVARAAFETTALDLPIPRGPSRSNVAVVGTSAQAQIPVSAVADRRTPSSRGGLVELIQDPASRKAFLAITGDDDDGLHRIATYLAAMSPEDICDIESAVSTVTCVVAEAQATHDTCKVVGLAVNASGELTSILIDIEMRSTWSQGQYFPEASRVSTAIVPPGISVRVLHDGTLLETFHVDAVLTSAKTQDRSFGHVISNPGDLANFYEAGGPFNGDLGEVFPTKSRDLLAGSEQLALSPSGDGTAGTIELAARIALEATAITLPLVIAPNRSDGEPQSWSLSRIPVLIGTQHPLVRALFTRRLLTEETLPTGSGRIEIVPDAFDVDGNQLPAIVIRASDADGLSNTLDYFATVFPHIRDRGKDRATVRDILTELHDLLVGRAPAGQAAIAMSVVNSVVEPLRGQQLVSLDIELSLDNADPSLAAWLHSWAVKDFGSTNLTTQVLNRSARFPDRAPVAGVDCDFILPNEYDAYFDLLRSEVIDRIGSSNAGKLNIEAFLSESPEARADIAAQTRRILEEAGFAPDCVDINVFCAYKPAYSWLTELISRELADLNVDRIDIKVRKHRPPAEWPHQVMTTATRWVHELFPADAVLARDLGLAIDDITISVVEDAADTYHVIGYRDGAAVLHRSFSPRLILQPLIHLFPDYEQVQVTTGGITAKLGGTVVCDTRIETDIESFWRYYQTQTLPALYEYVMALTAGDPRPADSPLFASLRVELDLHEPDFRIGIAEELISSIDAMAEEIYLGTRRFFEVMGRRLSGTPLSYFGRIVPVVRAVTADKEQRCKITFAGFQSVRPHARIKWQCDGESHVTLWRITPRRLVALRALAVDIGPKHSGTVGLTVGAELEPLLEFAPRLRQMEYLATVDREWEFISSDNISQTFSFLREFRSASLFPDFLAYDGLGDVEVTSLDYNGSSSAMVPGTRARSTPKLPSINQTTPLLPVQWERPIAPAEANAILAEMAGFAEATVYKAGESYLGKDIWCLDLAEPIGASHVSRLKLTTTKPTILFTARQHANEVSSTSHVLKLAELLLTDPRYRPLLKRVNVVIHPVHNVDGATLFEELSAISPNLMLHASYFGALGGDVGYGDPSDNFLMPEAKVRPKLWKWWLPDVSMNPHGQPGHEWVNPFSEYVGWAINRTYVVHSFWAPRGWFIPDAALLLGAEFKDHRKATAEILARIILGQNADAEAVARTAFQRLLYTRYTVEQDPQTFVQHVVDGVNITFDNPLGTDANSSRGSHYWMTRHPDITIWQGVTEAADEPCYGDEMKSVAGQGLRWDLAVLEYLAEATYTIDRNFTRTGHETVLSTRRRRPGTVVTSAFEARLNALATSDEAVTPDTRDFFKYLKFMVSH